MPTQPQWVAAYTMTGNPVIRLTFTDTTIKTLTLPGTGLTRYNDRRFLVASDLLAWVADEMTNTDLPGETWTASEPAGDYLGRSALTNTHPRVDTKTLNRIDFMTPTILSGADLGYDSNTVFATLAAPNYVLTGTWIRGRLWIPQGSSFMALDEVTREDTVVVTTSPDGTNTKDYYGGLTLRTTELLTVPAALVWPQYADSALFTAAVSGMTAGDLNAPLDVFRQAWRDTPLSIRYSPDLTLPSVYHDLNAVDPWIGNLTTAATPIGLSPRLYNVRLTALEV